MIRLTLFSLLLLVGQLHAVNVLILGSSQGFDKQESPQGHDTHLDLAKLAKAFERVLNRGNSGETKVTFQDIYTTIDNVPMGLGSAGKEIPTTFHRHSLAQYVFWPDGKEARLASLQNKGAQKWDYIFIIGDPYLISQMPGIYAEGVHLLMEQIKQGEAKVCLVTPWHSNDKINSRISEVVLRVAKGLDLPVAPAGEAWTVRKDRLKEDEAEYLAAASMVSALSQAPARGQNMAEENLAKLALSALEHVVKKSENLSEIETPPNPYYPEFLDKQTIVFCHSGSSSENGIKAALIDCMKRCNITPKFVKVNAGGDIDFNYGRANSNFEPNKRYKVEPDKYDRAYGFPMQEQKKFAPASMLYGIDKRYFHGTSYDDGTDLGIAYDMIRQGEVEKHIYAVPIRLLLAKLMAADPTIGALRDKWHMSRELDAATGSYMVTILTGKNPVGAEPDDKSSQEWKRWLGRKIGYETAMRMGRLTYEP
ncbi:MAG: hypothetical protein R3242_01560 [Akkermansiaceae bacterium]|nr:hypothetical protein [Akkermansiaceae bacterium]